MEEKQRPLIAFEITQVKHERTVKRLITALIIVIALFFASNALWLYAWMQYDYSTEVIDDYSIDLKSDDGGNANYIGERGNIYNGES